MIDQNFNCCSSWPVWCLTTPCACAMAQIDFTLCSKLQNGLFFSHRKYSGLQVGLSYLTTNPVFTGKTSGPQEPLISRVFYYLWEINEFKQKVPRSKTVYRSRCKYHEINSDLSSSIHILIWNRMYILNAKKELALLLRCSRKGLYVTIIQICWLV